MPTFDLRQLIAFALTFGLVTAIAHAQTTPYPDRKIVVTLSIGPGSPQDLVIRTMNDIVSADLKQPVIIDYRPGASGGIANTFVTAQPPDGYTLYAATSAAIATLPLTKNLAYDPASDLTYIMQMMVFPIGIAVKADSPFKSWADVVAFAKANPGKITYGTPGQTTMANLGMQRLQALAGIALSHVPHRNAMEIIPAVLGEHVMLMVSGLEWKPHVDNGKMRLLMMWTDRRLPAFANTPTGREFGYAFDLDVSMGLVAPRGMEASVQSRLHGAFKKAFETPPVRAVMEKHDIVPSYLDGASYKARTAGITADLKPIIEKLGLARKQ